MCSCKYRSLLDQDFLKLFYIFFQLPGSYAFFSTESGGNTASLTGYDIIREEIPLEIFGNRDQLTYRQHAFHVLWYQASIWDVIGPAILRLMAFPIGKEIDVHSVAGVRSRVEGTTAVCRHD